VSYREYQSQDGRDVAIADGLQGDGCAFRELRKEGRNRSGHVANPRSLNQISLLIQHGKKREVLAQP
jgi:hypothetical protein